MITLIAQQDSNLLKVVNAVIKVQESIHPVTENWYETSLGSGVILLVLGSFVTYLTWLIRKGQNASKAHNYIVAKSMKDAIDSLTVTVKEVVTELKENTIHTAELRKDNDNTKDRMFDTFKEIKELQEAKHKMQLELLEQKQKLLATNDLSCDNDNAITEISQKIERLEKELTDEKYKHASCKHYVAKK